MKTPRIIALCGGVGGAKLALGLSHVLRPDELAIVVNTADDFQHLGLPVCPDLDTVMYTLASVANPDTGWGRDEESWNCMNELTSLNGETWFRLGDKDIALHLQRRHLLNLGNTLSDVTAVLCKQFSLMHTIIPMSDDPVATVVLTEHGEMPFQEYFVREQCHPKVRGFRFDGIDTARPSPGFQAALEDKGTAAVLICPSNPFVSIDPILDIPGVRQHITEAKIPVFAVSPIVGGEAIKGPAAKMLRQLGHQSRSPSVCKVYGDLLTGFVADSNDLDIADEFPRNLHVEFTNTLMSSLDDKVMLAEDCLRIISAFNDAVPPS